MPEIRMARAQDCRAMLDIYRPFIENTAVSFEMEVPGEEAFLERLRQTLTRYPWLVCQWGHQIAGYAYAGPHRSREAYQWTVEMSVYVAEGFRRKRVARALYATLIELLKLQGFQNALAGITLPNDASIAFHESMGFSLVGVYHKVGFKMGAWHAAGWWELWLGPSSDPPAPPRFLPKVIDTPELTRILVQASRHLSI